ncbi:hypothetical protein [Endozoicomonas sp. SCSIO W0465]|uniref:hypothetical protein n=1 Tax=Endozoicomonas sp. SCSIO W0465 TaxID=2918516 RepID=UPI002074FFEC|nr:hypothetical protein [Endozoicomonas sp. SCSIO W0465]USE38533.1 hypothetical protein MJO57_10390 [Endozoicomonas sp. SCSIO W0465]
MEEQQGAMLKELKSRLTTLNLTNQRADEQASVSKANASNSGPVNDNNENPDNAEALNTISEGDPCCVNEQPSQGGSYLDQASGQCKKVPDRVQRHELLGRHRNMGLRLQRIDEQKVEIVQKKVRGLLDRASTAIDLFSGRPGQEEVEAAESLLEQARLELKLLSGSHCYPVRARLRSQINELQEKLQHYRDNTSDSQQTTAANSQFNQKIDILVKKEFDDYWKEYVLKSEDLEERALECFELGHPAEQRKGKM